MSARERDDCGADSRPAPPHQREAGKHERQRERVVMTLGGAPDRDRIETDRCGRAYTNSSVAGERGVSERNAEQECYRRNRADSFELHRRSERCERNDDQLRERDKGRTVDADRKAAAPLPRRIAQQRIVAGLRECK